MSENLGTPVGTIGKACLTSTAWFNCKIYFKYWNPIGKNWVNTNTGSTVSRSTTDCEFPGVLGAPNNSQIRLCINVEAGPDYFGTDQFIYQQGNSNNANYVVQGTTQDANLNFTGITGGHTGNAQDPTTTAAQAGGAGD